MSEEHKFVKKNITEEEKKQTQKKASKSSKSLKNKKSTKRSFKKHDLNKKTSSGDFSKKKVNRKKIEDDLFEIYGGVNNNSLDMKKLQKKTKGGFIKSLFTFLFSLAFFLAIAWAGFFMLEPSNDFSEDDINFFISGNEEIKIGESFSYRISYKNSQNIELKDAELEVKYPKGFVFVTSSVPSSDENNSIWKLGDIAANDSGYIDIEGQIYGNLNSEQSIRAFLNYIPENFSSEFQKVAHITINSNESPLDIDFEIPENIYKNGDTEFNLTLSPQEIKMENVKIVCEADNMVFKSSNLESVNNSCEWLINSLEKEENISFTVNFDDDVSSETKLKLQVLKMDEESDSEYVIYEKEETLNIVKSDFVFNLAINGVMSESTIKPGEVLNSSIVVKNSGESVLEDVVVNMTFDAPSYNNYSLLKWIDLNVEPYDADVYGEQLSADMRRGIITWTSDYVEGLEKIMPGEEVYIDFSLPLKDGDYINLANFEETGISASAEIEYKKDDIKEVKTSNQISLKAISDLDLDVMSDAKGGGIYKITWLLSNSFHDLKNVVLEADVYGKTKVNTDSLVNSSGEVEYDENENKIKWKIDELPKNIPDAIIMQFEVELLEENPTQEDLMSKVSVTAEDKLAEEIIKFSGDEVKL